MGRQLYERGVQVSRACEKLRQKLGHEPALSELAAETGLSESDTAQALCAAQPVLSLTAEDDNGACTLDIPVPSHAEAVETHLALEQALSLLAPADRKLLELRYRGNLTQSAAARQLGMTQVQVSRREKKLLLFLREQLLP
jgi:RNA polymerase sporulation-specific sigma factor